MTENDGALDELAAVDTEPDLGGRFLEPIASAWVRFNLSPARSNLFRALPELELPAKFSGKSVRQMIQRIADARHLLLHGCGGKVWPGL